MGVFKTYILFELHGIIFSLPGIVELYIWGSFPHIYLLSLALENN